MKHKNLGIALLLLFLLLQLSACAPSGVTEREYGFFSGILHGLVFPIALIGKLLGVSTGLYAEHNSGFLYWIGFILGLGGLGGGGGIASRR